jgi:uncharacterized protein
MGRLLLLIAIAAVVYLVIKSYLRKGLRQENPTAEDMVRCAHCGVHLPKNKPGGVSEPWAAIPPGNAIECKANLC